MNIQEIETYLNRAGWSTDDSTATSVHVSERGCGNGTDCIPDPAVVAAAKEIRKEIRERWPTAKCSLEACDEWIHIDVTLPS